MIPQTVDALTPEWLSGALPLPEGTTVRSVDATVGDAGVGFMGTVARLALTFDGDPGDVPDRVVAKIPTTDEAVRSVLAPARVFEREVRMYRQVTPQLGMPTARGLVAELDTDADEYLIVMDDLAPARVGDQLRGATREEAEAVVAALGSMHAAWWESGRLEAFEWMFPINSALYKEPARQVYAMSRPLFEETCGDLVPDDLRPILERFADGSDAMYDRLWAMPHTLVHMDFRLDNLFFADDGSVAVIDFQASCVGGGVTDLGYFISQSLATDVRRGAEGDLLRAYHDALVEGGVGGYPFDRLVDDVRWGVLYGWIIPVFAVGSLDMSSDRALRLFRTIVARLVEAMRDHRCVEVLEEALS